MGHRETLRREVGSPGEPGYPWEAFVSEAQTLSTLWTYRFAKYVIVPFLVFVFVKFAVTAIILSLLLVSEILGVVAAEGVSANNLVSWVIVVAWVLFGAWVVWESQSMLRGLLKRLKLAGAMRRGEF